MNKAYVEIDLNASHNTRFKVYWANKGQSYSEKRSAEIFINKRKSNYLFYLANIKNVEKLRFDPAEKPTRIRINKIIIKQNHYSKIIFSNPDEFSQLIPINDIKDIHNDKAGYIMVVTSGNDPQLEAHIMRNKETGGYINDILKIICLVALFIILFKYFNVPMQRVHFTYVSYLMVVAGALIVVMGSMSKFNRHPDEYVHVKAGDYYEDHWLPPKICEPGTESTYSVYGVSRLNSHELVYFIAGKFSALFGFLPIRTYLRLRAFNMLLFAILAMLCIKKPAYRIIFVPLLLSPQIWYVFSYFNSDAFSIFIVFIAICQIVFRDSLLNRYLDKANEKTDIFSGLTLGFLLYLLLTLKKNYYFFLIFLFVYLVIKLFEKVSTNSHLPIKRLIFIVSILVSIVLARFTGDIYINGSDRAKKIDDCREKLAKYIYKQSTAMEERMPGLNLRERGVPLTDLLSVYHWGEKCFRSAFGVYGYTTISASKNYYHIPRIMGIILLLFISWSSLIGTDRYSKMLFLNAIICSVLLMGAALWKSWTSDFQAQGRYFLPIIAMGGFLLYQIRDRINARILNLVVVVMFFMSIYSFIFVGFAQIPKYAF